VDQNIDLKKFKKESSINVILENQLNEQQQINKNNLSKIPQNKHINFNKENIPPKNPKRVLHDPPNYMKSQRSIQNENASFELKNEIKNAQSRRKSENNIINNNKYELKQFPEDHSKLLSKESEKKKLNNNENAEKEKEKEKEKAREEEKRLLERRKANEEIIRNYKEKTIADIENDGIEIKTRIPLDLIEVI